MSIERVPARLRKEELFHHIDMGFLNRRLCLTALPPLLREWYFEHAKSGSDHMTVLSNDHLLVTILLDACSEINAPTLLEALEKAAPRALFRSTEHLEECPDIYEADRVEHAVVMPIDFGKPVIIAYHTEHLVSSTGKMTLADGYKKGYVQSIVGLLHNKPERFEIEPLVIGAPWFDHPRNRHADETTRLMFLGRDFGELLPEDIDQFSKMSDITVKDADEWLEIMRATPEAKVKTAIATLLNEPSKKDWGGETNDHFSSNVLVGGKRYTGAFMLKGPADFREMTLDMCGKRADQIYRLAKSNADISFVQHAHLIGEAVRSTLRAFIVQPGQHRKYCLIDGQATYRILKAYQIL